MLFSAKRRCHSGSLRETGGVQSCVLMLCPEAFSPTTNCPITRAKCASSASYRARIRSSSHLRAATIAQSSTSSIWNSPRFIPRLRWRTTQIATISTDDHHTLQEFRASVGAQWTFLSDPERTIQKDLDIQEYTDPEHNPMIPHTLVFKPGAVIYSIYNGYWFWGRPSVIDLWHDLRAVTSEIRPDWDLSTPGLREAWNAGDF